MKAHCNDSGANLDRSLPGQGGFAIVSAVFLLVVLAALGAFMLTFSSVQHATSAQDIQGSRAYWAAQSGIEWGIYKVLDPLGTTVVAPPPGATWPNMPPCPAATLAISGFSVVVSCTSLPAGAVGASGPPVYTEAGDTRSIIIYELTATATAGTAGTPGYVKRVVSATVSKCRASDAISPYDCP